MPDATQGLGGRTALIGPDELSTAQRKVYSIISEDMVPWAEKAGFTARLRDGRLVGPFNTVLLSPEIAEAFLALQGMEGRHTSLSARVRQVVILTIGAVWSGDYERYAHGAVAHQMGFGAAAIEALKSAGSADELTSEERVAQRFTLTLATERHVDDALFEEARTHFADRGIVDLIMLAGCYDLISSLLNAFDVPVPD